MGGGVLGEAGAAVPIEDGLEVGLDKPAVLALDRVAVGGGGDQHPPTHKTKIRKTNWRTSTTVHTGIVSSTVLYVYTVVIL